MTKTTRVIAQRLAGPDHAVITLKSEGKGARSYRREPCEGCPWKKSNTGRFPAEAFKHSAPVAYDGAFNTFSCHESGRKHPADCAGFLLRNSVNNIAIRIAVSDGKLDMRQVHAGRKRLFRSYREMAVANGVPADDPILAPCRADDE